ncbi:MAG TPA: M24 family metallopeptidase [Phototrophicaceae bacterium]|nr:M24 family metallopeptidase [Phototrophicaceae bacterium]
MDTYSFPAVLPLREQARVTNQITAHRFETVLPMVMRETGIDLWLIICNEDNHDPVFSTLIPWECWAPILQMVVFFDRGGENVERYNVSITDMQGLMTSRWGLNSGIDQWAALKQVIEECNPQKIGVNTSDVIWAADGLTHSLHNKLKETLGADLSSRIVSAEPLAIRWLETRTTEELALYSQACSIAHAVMKRGFSRDVITPGVTTSEDLRWYYWQTTTDLGLPVSFPAFYRRHRSNRDKQRWGDDDKVIRPGDLLHCDVGFKYMRLLTDHQEMAYVLRGDETDAPAGLKNGIRQANQLQDIFTSSWQEGLTGNEILKRALTRAREAGICKPKIYSHSLSFYLHEPGPLMGLPWEQESCPGRGDVTMHYNTVYTVELSVTCPVPEWDDQEQSFSLEQDAVFLETGVEYLDGRQLALHLI